MNTSYAQNRIHLLSAKAKAIKLQYKQEKKALRKAESYLVDTVKAQQIAQAIAAQLQNRAHAQIGNVVAACLRTIFGSDYGYKIDFVRKRGKTEAKLLLIKNGHEVDSPLESDSGGVLDIGGFAQRLSCLRLGKPQLRPVLILDEPFKNLSRQYQRKAASLLEELSKQFKIQFVIVTHIRKLTCGKVIKL